MGQEMSVGLSPSVDPVIDSNGGTCMPIHLRMKDRILLQLVVGTDIATVVVRIDVLRPEIRVYPLVLLQGGIKRDEPGIRIIRANRIINVGFARFTKSMALEGCVKIDELYLLWCKREYFVLNFTIYKLNSVVPA